jgi:hypothetical protein
LGMTFRLIGVRLVRIGLMLLIQGNAVQPILKQH